MKKVISVIIVMVMVFMVNCAFASEYGDAYDDVKGFVEENGWTKYYNDSVDDWGVYGCIGLLDIDGVEKTYQVNGDWDHVETWFGDWYEENLKKLYPEFGELSVVMTKAGTYNGRTIWHITISAMEDLVDYIDGDQNIVDLMCVFY